jgi:hypothetical protein
MRFGSLLAAIVAVSLGISGSVMALPAQAKPTAERWSWLEDTYWIVPSPYLPAVLFNPSTQRLTHVSDQTVYHITGYEKGYFWGKNVTQLGDRAVSCSSLVGSVTPEGQLLLLFTVVNDDDSVTLHQGFGTMVQKGKKKRKEWTMLNQTGSEGFAHWAYMVQSKPGDASWDSLPGVGESVEEFRANCPDDGPQPVNP